MIGFFFGEINIFISCFFALSSRDVLLLNLVCGIFNEECIPYILAENFV